MPRNAVARYDHLLSTAARALAEARTIPTIKDVRDKAEAIRTYAKHAGDRDMELNAAEVRFRAERRLGEMLQAAPKAKGTRGMGRPGKGGVRKTPPKDDHPSLEKLLGPKHKSISRRAREMASLPARDFEMRMHGWRERYEKGSSGILPRPADYWRVKEWEDVAAGKAEPIRPRMRRGRRRAIIDIDPLILRHVLPRYNAVLFPGDGDDELTDRERSRRIKKNKTQQSRQRVGYGKAVLSDMIEVNLTAPDGADVEPRFASISDVVAHALMEFNAVIEYDEMTEGDRRRRLIEVRDEFEQRVRAIVAAVRRAQRASASGEATTVPADAADAPLVPTAD